MDDDTTAKTPDESMNIDDDTQQAEQADQGTIDAETANLLADLQRTRADFENYRKRTELDKTAARAAGKVAAIPKLLPVVDTIDRAIGQIPTDIASNKWVEGVAKLPKSLEKSLEGLGVRKIATQPGDAFDPEFHEAIQFDEESTGESEVIAEVLQAGYLLDGVPMRHAMVRVTRQ